MLWALSLWHATNSPMIAWVSIIPPLSLDANVISVESWGVPACCTAVGLPWQKGIVCLQCLTRLSASYFTRIISTLYGYFSRNAIKSFLLLRCSHLSWMTCMSYVVGNTALTRNQYLQIPNNFVTVKVINWFLIEVLVTMNHWRPTWHDGSFNLPVVHKLNQDKLSEISLGWLLW